MTPRARPRRWWIPWAPTTGVGERGVPRDIAPLAGCATGQERQIILLRFFHNKTQSEIAQEVGVSQMHVSRLLVKSLATLRGGMGVDA